MIPFDYPYNSFTVKVVHGRVIKNYANINHSSYPQSFKFLIVQNDHVSMIVVNCNIIRQKHAQRIEI